VPRKEVIGVHDWAEIHRLHFGEGVPINELARHTGYSRNTVRAVLRSEEPPRYERRRRPWTVDAVESEIRALLAAHPRCRRA
jgi:hypothetical protein